MSLDSKYPMGSAQHAHPSERLEAYEHTCRAVAEKTVAPANTLDPKQREALFTEKQFAVLVRPR